MEVQKNFLPVKQKRIDEAGKLFNLLYGAVSERKYGYLWAKRADEKITYPFDVSNHHERKAMAQKAIELNDAGFDVYYGVNLMDTPPAPYERATKETVTLQTAIGTDIDVEGGTHISSEKKKYPSFNVAKGLLPFTPSILINSGYGYHGLNLYATPLAITADNRKLAEQRNKTFIDVIRNRAGDYSKAVDGVGDLPRVLRVPGTRNYKLGISDDAPICHIVEVNDVRFSPEDIDKQLDALKPVQKPKERPTPTRKTVFDFAEDSPDFKEFRIRKMLDCISVVDGEYDKWLDVGFALYNEGLDCSLWEQWSRSQPNFKEGECERKWNGFHHDSSGITIGSLYQWAVEGGYDAKDIWKEWRDQNPELSNKNSHAYRADSENTETGGDLKIFNEQIAAWQETNQNAPIDKKIIEDLKSTKIFIDDLTTDNFTASLVVDISIRRKVALCKFYIPQLATKFYSVMKTAQRNAKDKIKELHAQKPPANIPPELQELADIKTSDFDSAVSEIVTQIKRNQKDFQKKYQEEQEKQQLEAKRKALLAQQLSTKKIIPDCPIDLFIPETVYFSNNGVGTQSFAKNGDLIQNVATKNPIVPIKILREPTKHITQYEIAVKTKNEWRHIVFDGDELVDTRKILRVAKDGGALIKDARALGHYFVEIIAANEDNLVEVKAFQQPGWKDKQFTDFAYPTGGDDYIVRRAGFNYQDDFEAEGDAELWKQTYIEACNKGGAIACIFLGTVFSAPLVRPLRIPNLQTHLYGEPNCGKSGLEILGASAFGNPQELIRTFGATLKNRQAVAAAYNDLPTFLDELETLNGGRKAEASLTQMIYEFFEGKANQANKRDGSAREAFKFKGSRVSTAERPLLKSNDPQGAFKRLLQIPCKEKLFDDQFASSLHFIPVNNFGHFGKPWIHFISEHLDEIKDKYNEFFKLYNAVEKKKKNVEPTLLRTVAVSSLSHQYFNVFLGIQKEFNNLDFVKNFDEILSLLPSVDDMDEALRAKSDLQSYVAGHDRFFAHENQKPEFNNEYSQGTNECYGKKFENTEIAILPTKLKTILEDELGYSSAEAIVAKWAKKGFLMFTKGRNFRYNIRLNGASVSTYRFKAGILISKDNTDNLPDEEKRSA